jgi:hypothetical protein
VRHYAEHIIKKRNDNKVHNVVNVDEALNDNHERDIDAKLKKWRLKERKHDF